jgi:prepilin-type processing-associated H-X9-DG protein
LFYEAAMKLRSGILKVYEHLHAAVRLKRPGVTASESCERSFSLLELLIVFSTILVLVALLLPAVKGALEASRKARCASNMRQFGMAFRMYQNDHGGTYPDPWVNNSDNWQSYLCGAINFAPYVGPNAYLPTNWLAYDTSTTAKRINGKFLCPTMVLDYKIPQSGVHNEWGYCLNSTRVEISYGANGWPWNMSQYLNVDLDRIYTKSGMSGVMTCGNNASWNSDNDWNATTAADIYDWAVVPVHGDMVNLLFMDGHVEAIDMTTTEGRSDFNFYWYKDIPCNPDTNPYWP